MTNCLNPDAAQPSCVRSPLLRLVSRPISKVILSAVVAVPTFCVALPAIAQSPEPAEPPTETTVDDSATDSGMESQDESTPQLTPQEPQANLQTICRYDPDSGFQNALGMRTYVTLTETDGDTVVMLERFASPVAAPDSLATGEAVVSADVSEVRSLTFYSTPIQAARQLLLDQPFYYATLLDIDEADLGTEGFEVIDKTLGCGQVAIEPEVTQPDVLDESVSETERADTPSKTPSVEPTIAELPNGNYRFASGTLERVVVSDEELAAAGGEVFLFRKFGETVTGEMQFLDETGGVFCISGQVEGDTVTGSLLSPSDLSPSDTVRAEDLVTGDLSSDQPVEAELNLSGFSRINAGVQLPIEACSEGTYQ